MFKGILTKLLTPDQQNQGYSLSEDEDFLYLELDGKVIGVFNARTSCLDRITEFISKQSSLCFVNQN